MKPIIELKEVWKIYQMGDVEVPALKGMNIKIYEKEFVAIIGSSGSGKSTSLNMVGCLDIPTKGSVFLEDIDISTLQESDLAQIRGKKIGFIFQTFNLITSLSALDNVTLPLLFQDGLTNPQKKKKAEDILEKVGLGHRKHHKPTELSGGERQRVAIARALINDPDIILADEPTGNLDSKTGKEVMDIIRNLHKEGKTIILITHDSDIAKYAERKIVISDGQVLLKKEKKL
jgi:putative ABC transport system ATP-binding protein